MARSQTQWVGFEFGGRDFAGARFDIGLGLRRRLAAIRDDAIGSALAEAHSEMGERMQLVVQRRLREKLIPERASARQERGHGSRGSRGLRAALSDPSQVQARRGSWEEGFTFGQPALFRQYEVQDYWRVIERGGGPVGLEMQGFLFDASGRLTLGYRPGRGVSAAQVYSLRLGGGKDVSAVQRSNLKGDASARIGRPQPDWAQIGQGASSFGRSGRGWSFRIQNAIRPVGYLAYGRRWLQGQDKRAIYQKWLDRMGVPINLSERGSGVRTSTGRTSLSSTVVRRVP